MVEGPSGSSVGIVYSACMRSKASVFVGHYLLMGDYENNGRRSGVFF